MKSPQLSTFITALLFAVIAFLITGYIAATPLAIAAIVFVAAFIAPLICTSSKSGAVESDENVKTLYVGNLPYRANETAIRELFAEQGTVHSVRLMKDKHTGKRRGFGFVEIAADSAEQAIEALNDTEFQQRTLKVREAKERPEKAAE